MEICDVDLSLSTEPYGVTIQMKPLRHYFCMVVFVFSTLQNEIWD